MKIRLSDILIITTLFLAACSSSYKLSVDNFSYLYKEEEIRIFPQFNIYHLDQEMTQLHFKVDGRKLLYVKNPSNNSFTARVKIHYRLSTSYESNMILDSSSFFIEDVNPDQLNNYLIGFVELKIDSGNYLMSISTTDLNRKNTERSFIEINKSDKLNRQNFKVVDAKNGEVLFDPYVEQGQKLRVFYNQSHIDLIQVNFYDREFNMPPPPFASFNPKGFDYSSDSGFIFSLSDTFEVKRTGFYHFAPNPDNKLGLSLFNFGSDYPKVNSYDAMLLPMRYIMSRQDFYYLKDKPDLKEAIESFWMNTTGKTDRAESLIAEFYGRVEAANYYFSSHVEGWKSDRGMIYTIFGAPNVIYKNGKTETWIYGEENNQVSINFVFVKVINPFSDNDYILNRSPIYKNNWYRAVDDWRSGRPHTL